MVSGVRCTYHPAMRRLPGLFAVLVVAAAFVPTLGDPFLSDDASAVRMVSERGAWQDFTGPQYGLSTARFYRPLLTLSLEMQYAVSGSDPFLWRLANLLFLLATVWLLYVWATKLDLPPWAAAACALAFGLGAPAPGATAWVVGRSDGLMTLLAIGACLTAAATQRVRVAVALAVAACLVKETPAGLLLYFLWYLGTKPGWKVHGPRVAAGCLAGLMVARRLALGSWTGGYAGGASLVPGWGHLEGLPMALGRVLCPGVPWAGAVMLGLLVVWVALGRDRKIARLLASVLCCCLPLVQLWPLGADPLHSRLYLLPSAFLCLAVGRLASGLGRAGAARWGLLGLWTAAVCVQGGGGGIADHHAAGAKVAETDHEVRRIDRLAGSDGPPLLLVDGVPGAVGSAYCFRWGLADRYALQRPDARPVWPLQRVFEFGDTWARSDSTGPVVTPFDPGEGLRIGGRSADEHLDAVRLGALADGRTDVLWTLPEADGWRAVLLTPLGQNVGVLGEGRVFGLRDCLLAPLAGPDEPGGNLALLQVLAQAFDLGGREAWLFFLDASGSRTAAIRLVLADDAGAFLLP